MRITKSHGPLRYHMIGYFYYFIQIQNRNLINLSGEASDGLIKEDFFRNRIFFII
jgi:hypothetical protein